MAADQAIILTQADSDGSSAADGLSARLEAAGYNVTVTTDASSLIGNINGVNEVWDLRYNTALSSADSANYLSYLQQSGGLFLIGENSGFATRNNSLVDFVVDAGGGTISYGGQTVVTEYVTDAFNGDSTVTTDSATSFYVPAAGTFASSGNGTYITTTSTNGTGNGTGIAFGAGSLTNALTGRLLTYLDVNTFQAEFYDQTPALRALVDRMITFVAGDFQVDPDLPAVGGEPTTIDTSKASFNLGDAAATGSTITFAGGTLDMNGGSDPSNAVTADVAIGDEGAFINTAGGTSSMSGTITGSGGMVVEGQGAITLSGTNTYTGGTVTTDASTVNVTNAQSLGTGNVVLMGGTLATLENMTLDNGVVLMSGANAIDTGAQDVTLDGAMSGDGSFTKQGNGTLTLTGTNSYTGGTTVAAGTLVGNTQSLQGNVVDNAALVFDQASDGTFAGDVSGSGSLTKQGDGTLTLTGANSYTGGTTIAAGTLVGNTQSLQGNVVDNAALVFDQASDGTFAGDVSGSGSLTKQGDGTLTLTGANSYTGGTTVAAGTLVGNTDSIQGPVLDNAALTFDQSYNGTYADTISGTGSLTKSGTGTVNLTGASDYTGATTVTAGRLAVNGSIVNSIVSVDDGGTIGGNGIIGGLIVHSNGKAAPGNSIGQLNVAGDVTFEKGSIYEAEIDAAGHSDLIVASGKATIEGGTVSVLAQNGNYKPQGTYLILTANQGVSGAFDAVTSNLAFLVPTLSYSTGGVYVTMTRNDVTFAQAGTTANQRTTGAAIDGTFKIGTPVYDALVGSSTSEIGSGLDALSGEVHASALSAVADDAAGLRRTLLDRAASPIDPDHHVALWGEATGDWLKRDSSASTAKLSTSGYRMLAGVDVSFGERFRIGAAGGTSDITANVAQRASKADVDATFGAVYANAAFGPVRLRAGATYAGLDFDTTRSIDYRSLQETLKAKYDGSVKQVFGEAGLVLPLGAGSVEPFAGFTGMWLKNDGFAETGGTAALQADGRPHGGYGWTTLGVRATVGDQTSPILGHVKAAWEHATSSVDVVSVQSFVAGGDAFSIYGAPLSRNAMNLDASVEWRATGALSFTVGYTGLIGSRNTDNGIRGSAVFRF